MTLMQRYCDKNCVFSESIQYLLMKLKNKNKTKLPQNS